MQNRQKRLKFIRIIEKFLTRSISYIKDDSIDFETFKKLIDKNFKEIERIDKVELYSNYYRLIIEYINYTLEAINNKQYDDIKKELLYRANQIHKEKNRKSFKKKNKYNNLNNY